ncbi:MAG TPA: GAF domain-containing SpoIIE family protein phosphatase [Terriglobia bacterium]|nr:GAF domain-containing SpoIIE family protein phosphatase [Terriglobia bacterium]
MSSQKPSSGLAGVEAGDFRWSRLSLDLAPVHSSWELAPLLQHILRLLQKEAPDHSAGVFLLDEETHTIQGQVSDLFDRELTICQGGLQDALRRNVPYLISDLSDRRRANCPPEEDRYRSQIVVPIPLTSHVRAALILRSRRSEAYSEEDGQALAQFAQAVARRIENALLRQRLVRIGETETELDMIRAQEIMARLIPRQAPRVPGFDVASLYIPAKVVGGDLLDFLELPDEHFGLLVADAAGNGVPAALMMTGFRALFRGLIKNDFNIRSVFRKANNQLLDSTAPHQFVSAFYAGLDTSTRRLIYVNGGHVPPLLFRPGQPVRRLDMGGPVLGILPGASYHEDSVVLHPRDVLVCFSDGLSEAENELGEVFDNDRIQEVVAAAAGRPAQEICDALQEAVSRFVGGPLHDDLTICVLKFP